jgi:hemerythrin superfamily protein
MRTLKVKEIDRDETLGIIKKEITLTNGVSFTSPSRGIKPVKLDAYLENNTRVKEIVKRVTDKDLNSLEEGSSSKIVKEIKKGYQKNGLNLVIFDLRLDEVPDKNKLTTLAHHLYASSENTVILPTVKPALFKEDKKFSEKKVLTYQNMMKFIIDEIQAIGNSKAIIGTVPLIAPKYSRPIVNLYHEHGINAFAIDANTSDFILHETDVRSILSSINTGTPLNETFIYACNLGYPKFEKNEARADDFLSLFAYVDVMGGTFKV